MNDQSSYNLLLEMNARLARVEARLDSAADSRMHIRNEIADVKAVTAANKTAITLAKGGIGLATLASALAGFLVFFGEPEQAPAAPYPSYYPAPEPFVSPLGSTKVGRE